MGANASRYAGRRVLVTGGAGFIGSELVRRLLDEGARVRVVDDLSTGRRENLPPVRPERLALVIGDLTATDRWDELLEGIEIVFHLACLGVRHSLSDPLRNWAVNADATVRLLAAARDARVARFVHVSSSEVYGDARFAPMNEDHPTFPNTIYGAGKLAGEAAARAFGLAHGLPVVILRPFNAYGPRAHHEGASGEVIPKFLLRAMAGRPLAVFGDGLQTRDFVHVRDLARGLTAAGAVQGIEGRTFNLASGREIAIRDLAALVTEIAGDKGTEIRFDAERPGDTRRLCGDATAARDALGFTTTVELREGLAELRDLYSGAPRTPEDLLAEESQRPWETGGAR